MLGDHPEAVEAALIFHTGQDKIADYWRGGTSLRQLRVLVENLPPDSAVHRAVAGHDWRAGEFLTAALVDRVGQLVELTRAMNFEPHTVTWPPLVLRPGDADVAAQTAKATAKADEAMRDVMRQMTPGR